MTAAGYGEQWVVLVLDFGVDGRAPASVIEAVGPFDHEPDVGWGQRVVRLSPPATACIVCGLDESFVAHEPESILYNAHTFQPHATRRST